MSGKVQTRLAAGWTALTCLVLSTPVLRAQTPPASDTVRPAQAVARTIVVSLKDRRLALLEDGVVKEIYRVAIGTDTSPSPAGVFTIVNRVTHPTYYHDGKVIPPGPENPVGTRWMGLSDKGYGIHGTNEPHSIGKAASHGCIRMGRRDLEDLFARVRNGDVVEIVGESDAETAAIFGTPWAPGTPGVAAMVAKAEPLAPPAAQADDSSAVVETAPAPAER